MAVITISRGSYQRGKEVAEKVALKLGYQCISRDILLEASEEFNIPEIKLVRALHDAPTVLDRFRHGKERYVSYLRSALMQHVRSDNVVYHGLAGHYFLSDIPTVFKVRIIADMEDRVRDEVRREGISAEKARYILTKDDEERRRWGLQVYGTDFWDSRLYDMVLKIGSLKVEDAVEIIANAATKPVYRATAESDRMIQDLALATHVQARLVRLAPKIHVSASDGAVFVRSLDPPQALNEQVVAQIEQEALRIEGVREVHIDAPPQATQSHRVNPFHNIG